MGSDSRQACLCQVPGCVRPPWARGVCNRHYAEWYWSGRTFGLASLPPREPRPCRITGCDRRVWGKAVCPSHALRRREGRLTDPIRPHAWQEGRACAAPGCAERCYSRGLCKRHYNADCKWNLRGRARGAPHPWRDARQERPAAPAPVVVPRTVLCPKWALEIRREVCWLERYRGCWCERGEALAKLEGEGGQAA